MTSNPRPKLALKKPSTRARAVRKTPKPAKPVKTVKPAKPAKPASTVKTPEAVELARAVKAQRLESANTALAWMCQVYTHMFDSENVKPLRIGVGKELHKVRPPGITYKGLSSALGRWCSATPYHQAVVENKERFNLDGSPEGEVSDRDREHAQQILDRREKNALRRKSHERTRPHSGDERPSRTSQATSSDSGTRS